MERLMPFNPLFSIALDRRQAAVLAGFSFRFTLRDILLANKRNQPEWDRLKTEYSWWVRDYLYKEIDTFSGMKYAENCLLPDYRERHRGATLADLNAVSGLHQVEKTLREAPNIRVLHNVDDPLLSAADRKFLTETLGSRITWFDCGGHLGNLFARQHEEQVLRSFPAQPKPSERERTGKESKKN